ncbi:hypothetical protein NP233_g7178 [Leucocoprinus birnbaumii]|uniref:NF-X1-type domain-containing protein n=1 Tax=Leucocoprinus birnbaumii TaxID=56174 RepID=A0AAD5VSZ8_9AGAR|nr:hypothetical protein NP233_g7178 [Leucocoprinus birnbaumii]
MCACGKKTVQNVRCSLESEKVSCGAVCGRLLSCGFHHCERSCHADDCGKCTATCGKLRKSCLPDHHPCPLPCHAPSSCSEAEPCPALETVTCPCGRIKQAVRCGRSSSNFNPSHPTPKCTNDCAVAKRNARLAEALGINPAKSSAGSSSAGYAGLVNTVNYSDDLLSFGRINPKFLGVVEKAFADFLGSQRRTQVLPHMPPDRRKFVQELATYYRLDVQLVDQEPHRSVQLIRRLDTRLPSPLLSATIQQPSSSPGLGKLGDLRNLRTSSNPPSSNASSSQLAPSATAASWRPVSTPSPRPIVNTPGTGAGAGGGAGWSAVVAPQPQVAAARLSSGWGAAPTATGGSANASPSVSRPQSTGVPTATMRPSSAAKEGSAADVPRPATDEPVPENWEDDV